MEHAFEESLNDNRENPAQHGDERLKYENPEDICVARIGVWQDPCYNNTTHTTHNAAGSAESPESGTTCQ